jgi:hypothetical protein
MPMRDATITGGQRKIGMARQAKKMAGLPTWRPKDTQQRGRVGFSALRSRAGERQCSVVPQHYQLAREHGEQQHDRRQQVEADRPARECRLMRWAAPGFQ